MRLGVFLIALVAAGSVLVARSGTDQAASGGSAAGQLLLLYNSHGSVRKLSASAGRYSYVVLQPWDTAGLRAVKRRNPHAIVLAYQEASAIARAPGVNGITASGVGWKQAGRHEAWFLHNRSGGRITESGYSFLYMANIGNRGYQRQWAANVSRLLRRGPWDGVLMDDVNTTAGFHTDASQIAEYPDDGAYAGAMKSFLDHVRPAIHGTRKLQFANIGGWVDNPATIRDWLHKLDGAMDEAWVKFDAAVGQGYRDRHQWDVQLDEVRTAESMGKRFLAVTRAQPFDGRARLFGWASLLLASRARAGYLPATGFGYDNVPPTVGASERNVGRPIGPARSAGGLVYRLYSRALVVVNPGGGSQQVHFTVPVAGSGLAAASSTTMPGHTALVLHRASGSTMRLPQLPLRVP